MSENPSGSRSRRFEDGENIGSNTSSNESIGDVIATRLSRRDLIGGLCAAGALGAVLPSTIDVAAAQRAASPSEALAFNFKEVAAGSDGKHHVAEGYDADILIRWGDKVLANAPPFDPAAQTAAAQARQFGYNNDFLGYLPIDGSSSRGLLVVNHEYTNEELMFPGVGRQDTTKFAKMTKALADIEMMAHGGSVLEVRKTKGRWRVVDNSRYARRITAETEIRLSGPAAGHALLKTSVDPSGTRVKGMLNNCGGGLTPWGTWLSCEENFNGYFWGKAEGHPAEKSLKRYGAPGNSYNWGAYYDRFDVIKEPNEINRFGWIVEIDPYDPRSVPVKRTAMGRFKHEAAGGVVNRDGRYVVYSGDDERFDYVYKFVTEGRVNRNNRSANRNLLDNGTLYVARFNAGGSGEWLPLVHGQGKLDAAAGFPDQASVLVHTRLAADMLGATKMDRPEDIDVNPKSNKVYVLLTNNRSRTAEQVDAANPRANNLFGHIIEIMPEGGDHASTRFRWEILVRCGNPSVAAHGATFNPATTKNGWFGMPDNSLVDRAGRLWIATDGNSPQATGRADGLWALETDGPGRGTSKLFFRCPDGAEMCGPEMTPDMTTMFLAIQHPGESEDPKVVATYENPATRWPDFEPGMPPRPSIVAVTRKGGSRIA